MIDADGQVTLNDPPVGSFNVSLTAWGYEKAAVFCDFREGQTYDAGTITVKKSEITGLPGGVVFPE
ncbi:MAG: hypothetical protein L3J82_08110 [Planctomycetes bacterium]|nr:hypothetical protein [Planctomycetota bacterium]